MFRAFLMMIIFSHFSSVFGEPEQADFATPATEAKF